MVNRTIKKRLAQSLILFLVMAVPALVSAASSPVHIFVSILPQKFFVERIAGDLAEVDVMAGPGQSPETYEPSPRQLSRLSSADIYFSIGVPFEKVWMPRIHVMNEHLIIVDTSKNAHALFSSREVEDPHIWVSPPAAIRIAEEMMETMVMVDPENTETYRQNYEHLVMDLERLDQEIRKILDGWLGKGKFLVMHPAWGYFAKTYGLTQIAIEKEGKAPTPRYLQKLIKRAREYKIQVVFIQQQHSGQLAMVVAKAIGARVEKIDPLAESYIENMRHVAEVLAESFK